MNKPERVGTGKVKSASVTAVSRAIAAMQKRGLAVGGVRVRADGSVEVLTDAAKPAPDDDLDAELEQWSQKIGQG